MALKYARGSEEGSIVVIVFLAKLIVSTFAARAKAPEATDVMAFEDKSTINK